MRREAVSGRAWEKIFLAFSNRRNKDFVDRVMLDLQVINWWNISQNWPPLCTNQLQWPHEQSQAKISVQPDKTRLWERCLQIDFQLSKDIQLFCKSKKDKHFCILVISLQINYSKCTLREVKVVLASSVLHHQLPEDLNLVKTFLAPSWHWTVLQLLGGGSSWFGFDLVLLPASAVAERHI